MNRKNALFTAALVLGLLALSGTPAPAQTAPAPDRAVVPLTDPAKPAVIHASVMRGSITVKAYSGKEVIVEATVREKSLTGEDERWGDIAGDMGQAVRDGVRGALATTGRYYGGKDQDEKKRSTEGMKRLSVKASGLEVEERNNQVSIETQSWKYATDLVIQVPAASALKLESVNDGAISVEGVAGEIEVECVNGPVTLRNVSGTAVVESVNGAIEATFARLGDKPMSFSTMNGDVDITLPADVKASLKLKSEQGDIYSDFDVALKQTPVKSTESGSEKGRYRVSFEKALIGTINGGGPEMSFSTFNGDVFLRRRK